jgi:hypothetical protein
MASSFPSSKSQLSQQLLHAKTVVRCDVLEQGVEQSNFQQVVVRDCNMVLPAALGRQLNVGAGLPPNLVSQAPKRPRQFGTGTVPRDFHAASTSSRM